MKTAATKNNTIVVLMIVASLVLLYTFWAGTTGTSTYTPSGRGTMGGEYCGPVHDHIDNDGNSIGISPAGHSHYFRICDDTAIYDR